MKYQLFPQSLRKIATGLTLLLLATFASAEFLPDDVHWFYEYGGPSPEPFVVERSGSHLYVGGLFLRTSGDDNKKNLTRFNLDTEAWESVPGINSGFNGGVWAIHHADDGNLYFGGNFTRILGASVGGVVCFDPRTSIWQPLVDADSNLVTTGQENGPTNGRVFAIQKIGDLLYVGGEFTGPSRSPQNEKYIRSFNLKTKKWAKVGDGLDSDVRSLTKAPDGSLIAGGGFTGAIARFAGGTWSLVGGGVQQTGGGGIVRALAYGADGTLYLGGDFDELGTAGTASRDIAAFKNGTWNTLAGGFDDTYVQSNGTTFASNGVQDIAVSGNTLYAGGDFDASNGRSVLNLRHVAVWGGTAWQSLGSGVGTTGSQTVNGLAIGRDNDLFVVGTFNEGHKNANSAKYQMARWHPNRDFTDYVPGAADNTTSAFFQNEDGGFQLTIETRPGTTYEIEASADAQTWTPIGGTEIGGDGSRRGFNLNKTARERFYRFRAKRF